MSNTPYQPHNFRESNNNNSNSSKDINKDNLKENVNQNNNSNYFSEIKKGEIAELRQLLKNASNERDVEKIRTSLQRIINYMTMGIDVSPLFPDIIMVVNTTDLIIKKLVYLYICHYAVHGDNDSLLLLVINTLCLDFQDSNPMVRGLALRSLCSFDSQTTFEYSFKCVLKSLTDASAYVRKTGVIGLAKLYHSSEKENRDESFEDLIPKIYGMIMDQDSQVIVNALFTLDEIRPNWEVTQQVTHHLMAKFREMNEWGQSAVINTLCRYELQSEDEIFDFLNFFDEKLKHSNSSLVLSIAKLFIKVTENDVDIHEQVYERLKDPLITLMESGDSDETRFTILSHIHLIMSRTPNLFRNDYKYFYCLHREPSYIKREKVKVLKELVSADNIADILDELSEYVYFNGGGDDDKSFSREVIDTITSIALQANIPSGYSGNILKVLIQFLDSDRFDSIVPFTLIALSDYLRMFPDAIGKVLPLVTARICGTTQDLQQLVDPQAMEALLWMLAEFPDVVDNTVYIIESIFELICQKQKQPQLLLSQSQSKSQQESPIWPPTSVKIQLLTSCVKLFTNFSTTGQIYPILIRVFKEFSSMDCDPDLRDQCLFYYRLIIYDIEKAASKIININSQKNENIFVEDELLESRDKIFEEFNTLSILYGKHSTTFVKQPPTSMALIIKNTPTTTSQSLASTKNDNNKQPDLLIEFETSHQQIVDNFTLESSPEIQPEEFQEYWLKLEEDHKFDIQLEKPLDINEMERLLTSKGIMCLAYGSVGGMTKLYYYGKEIDGGPLFLIEILVNEQTLLMTLCFKSNDQRKLHSKLFPLFISTISKMIPNI